MVKLGLAALAAAPLCMTDEPRHSRLQDRWCENYPPNATVPWLETDANTKLPKGAILSLDVAPLGSLRRAAGGREYLQNCHSLSRSM
jgi:hypothetical protein